MVQGVSHILYPVSGAGLTDEKTECPVKLEIQINNEYFFSVSIFSISTFHQIFGTQLS